jgi:hypothetical protein
MMGQTSRVVVLEGCLSDRGMGQKIGQEPQGPRRGWLKNGNPPGDFLKALRCGARTRRGTSASALRCEMDGAGFTVA